MCVRGAWWAGQRAAAHQWWASYKVRIAQYRIHFVITTTWWEGACLSVRACLLLSWQQAGVCRTARISTRPPLTAASQQDTPIHTHHTTTTRHAPPLIGRRRGALLRVAQWRGVRLLFVLGVIIIIICWPVIRTSEALLEREPNAHTRTHTQHTRTARVVWWWWWQCARVCRQQEPRLCIERERERSMSLSVCLCDVEHIHIYMYV